MPFFFSLWCFRSCEYELKFQANWLSQMMKSGAKHSPSFCNSRRPFGIVSKFWRVGGLQVWKFENLKELQMSSETGSGCHFSLAYDASDPVSMNFNPKWTDFRSSSLGIEVHTHRIWSIICWRKMASTARLTWHLWFLQILKFSHLQTTNSSKFRNAPEGTFELQKEEECFAPLSSSAKASSLGI